MASFRSNYKECMGKWFETGSDGVTAKDYAVQYLEEVSGIEEGNSYTEASKQAVKEA